MMKELIEKALKEVKEAIENVAGRYALDDNDWDTNDLVLVACLQAARRALEETKGGAK